jgi:hypothetical protein
VIDASSLTYPFRNASDSLPTRVKMEPDANATQLPIIKKEPNVCIDLSESASASQVRTRTVVENGTETIEILSDSEDEAMDGLADWGMDVSSDTLVAAPGSVYSDDDSESFDEDALSSDLELDLEVSATQWLDPEIESHVSDHPRRLNRQLLVERVEYLSDIPTYWPVPRQRTAYILDLRDPKFDVYNDKGEMLSMDALIKNKVCPNAVAALRHSESVYIYHCYCHRTRIRGQDQQVLATPSPPLTSSLVSLFHAAAAVLNVRDSTPVVMSTQSS